MAEPTATFNLQIKSDSKPTEEQTKALEELRASISKSQELIKQHGASLRALRGNSEDVTDARKQLKAAIEAERESVSRGNLAILKLGSSYEALSKQARAAASANKDLGKAVSAVGGPVADASEKFGSFKDLLKLCADPMVALGVVAAVTIAAVVALALAVGAATVSLAKFTVESANVLRAQGLLREAVTGSAEDAGRMGRQVEHLATQLATPREKLNELYVTMRRTFDGARISGQGILDTFTAVATTSAAMGDQAGAALQGIIDRSKRFGRGGINLFELQGTGAPQFDEIAKALAKSARVGVAEARAQLLTFRVPIDQLAAAMKDAADVRFSGINAKKLLDLDVIASKFRENLVGLSKTFSESAGYQTFLADLKTLADLFSGNTSTGATLQASLGAFGELLGTTFHAAMPYIIWAIKEAINLSLRMAIAFVDAATMLVDFAHSTAGLILMKSALAGVAIALGLVAIAFVPIVIAAAAIGLAFLAVSAAIYGIYEAVGWLRKQDWSAIGGAIIDGIKSGLMAAWNGLKGAVDNITTGIMGAFRGALGIESPSKVFASYGRYTAQGFAQGVEAHSDVAQDAVRTMVQTPDAPASVTVTGGGGSSGASSSVVFNIYGSGNPQETADLIREPSVLGAITHAIEIANRGLGIPTQSATGA